MSNKKNINIGMYIVAYLFAITLCTPAIADDKISTSESAIAVLIAKTNYEHPVRLLHPYLDYWHMKGPLAEKAAMQTLQQHFQNVNWCNHANNAKVVLLLEPHIFYNPQLHVFHSEIIAKVYTPDNKSNHTAQAIVTIKKQAQQLGELDATPEFYLEKAYIKAMEEVVEALDTNQDFLNSIKATGSKNAESICPALDESPNSKLYY
ncbi:MAG: hypothetical protein SFU55_03730 [Methylophilus sp.]|nr:hypothetical protein [Methylophilus sp.]